VQAAAAAESSLHVTLVGELVALKETDVDVELTNAPDAGELIETTGGGGVTVKVVLDEPVLPAWSVAVTVIVWLASESPLYDWPVVHAAAAAASSLQVVPVTFEPVPLVVKLTAVPVLICDEPFAGALIETVGTRLSTVKVTEAVPVPPALVALTRTVWLPWLSPE
jgi:hypothetical protein